MNNYVDLDPHFAQRQVCGYLLLFLTGHAPNYSAPGYLKLFSLLCSVMFYIVFVIQPLNQLPFFLHPALSPRSLLSLSVSEGKREEGAGGLGPRRRDGERATSLSLSVVVLSNLSRSPDSKVHGANMGPIWGRQDPGGPNVDPMKFAIWVTLTWVSLEASMPVIVYHMILHS